MHSILSDEVARYLITSLYSTVLTCLCFQETPVFQLEPRIRVSWNWLVF